MMLRQDAKILKARENRELFRRRINSTWNSAQYDMLFSRIFALTPKLHIYLCKFGLPTKRSSSTLLTVTKDRAARRHKMFLVITAKLPFDSFAVIAISHDQSEGSRS